MGGMSSIMTCQKVAGAIETGITVGGSDVVSAGHVTHEAKKILPRDPLLHSVHGMALILA